MSRALLDQHVDCKLQISAEGGEFDPMLCQHGDQLHRHVVRSQSIQPEGRPSSGLTVHYLCACLLVARKLS